MTQKRRPFQYFSSPSNHQNRQSICEICRLERNRLKGVAGNAINAILSAAAMNFHKLLRACERKLVPEIGAIMDRLLHQSLFIGFLINLSSA